MTALFAIHDTMQFVQSDVATICVGQAASAVAVLLAAGAKGKRFTLPNARVLIHQPHGGAQVQSTDLEIQVREMVELRERMIGVLCDATGKDRDTIVSDIDRDKILRGDDAVAYGLVDQVIGARALGPTARPRDAAAPCLASLRHGGAVTAPAMPAATVLVVRDGPGGVEVYVQRRPRRMGFAGGLWVFPGGRVDDADRSAAIDAHWAGPTAAEWADLLGVPVDAARGYVVAAYRETLEEAGMLLVEPAPRTSDVVTARRRLLGGTATFVDVVRDLDVALDTTLLRYWAWWVTPEAEPRRYDTRFFLAQLPRAAVVTPHGDEVTEEAWLSAPLRDDVAMLPPTHYTMAEVLACGSAAAAMDAAADRAVARVMPRIEDGEIVLPWNDRYRIPSVPSADW